MSRTELFIESDSPFSLNDYRKDDGESDSMRRTLLPLSGEIMGRSETFTLILLYQVL